jgi:hypothetical protein
MQFQVFRKSKENTEKGLSKFSRNSNELLFFIGNTTPTVMVCAPSTIRFSRQI